MVNLLRGRGRSTGPPRFDEAESARIEARLCTLFALARSDRLISVARVAGGLAAELEELDASPTRLAAEGLLGALDLLRSEVLAGAPGAAARAGPMPGAGASLGAGAGDFVCHRPGRSLVTGEAEIASRGFFDAWDRPPIVGWIGVLGATSGGFEDGVWIVAWVGPGDIERARAGCRACPNGALARVEDVSAIAADQLHAMQSRSVR